MAKKEIFEKREHLQITQVQHLFRRCLGTVSCTVPSCGTAKFRWIPTWEPTIEATASELLALPRGISFLIRVRF